MEAMTEAMTEAMRRCFGDLGGGVRRNVRTITHDGGSGCGKVWEWAVDAHFCVGAALGGGCLDPLSDHCQPRKVHHQKG